MIIAGRPRDLEDVRSVLLKNPGADWSYIRHWLQEFQNNFEHAVCLSAKTGENIKGLLDKLCELLSSVYVEIDVVVPISRMDLVNLAHKEGEVFSVKYYEKTINIRGLVPKQIAGRFYK